MVDFVEEATLRVRDQSTGNINKINKAIVNLLSTAKKLNSIKVKIDGVAKAEATVRGLAKSMKSIKDKRIKLDVKESGIKQIESQLKGLTKARTAKVTVTVAGAAQAQSMLNRLSAKRVVPITAKLNANAVTSQLNQMLKNRTANVRMNLQGPGATTPLNFSTGLIGMAITDAFRDGARMVRTAIIEGFGQQAMAIDQAQTGIRSAGLTPEKEAQAFAASRELAAANPTFDLAQITQLMSESVRTTRGDVANAKTLTDILIKAAERQILNGVDAARAIEQASKLGKQAEQTGAASDINGNFDPKGAQKFIDTMTKASIIGGKEVDPQLMQTTLRNLKVAKFGLDERGLLTLMNLAEEMGPRAGTGMEQVIKKGSGFGQSKSSLARMIEMGLITTKEVQKGTDAKGRPITETVVDKAKDNELLRADPAAWFAKNVIPQLIKEGKDVNNPAVAANAMTELFGAGTALDIGTGLILRNPEIQKANDTAAAIDVSQPATDKLKAQSLAIALAQAQTGFNNALGSAASSLETLFIPALQKAGAIGNAIAEFIAPGGEGTPGRTAAVAGAGIVATGAALAAGKGALNLLNPFAASANALNGSAAQLNNAAMALQRAAGVPGGVMPPSAKNGPNGRGWGRAGAIPGKGALALGAVAGLATMGGPIVNAAGEGGAAGIDYGAITEGLVTGVAFAYAPIPALLSTAFLNAMSQLDPNGNLGGVTKPLDDWIRANILGTAAKDTAITPAEIFGAISEGWAKLGTSKDGKPLTAAEASTLIATATAGKEPLVKVGEMPSSWSDFFAKAFNVGKPDEKGTDVQVTAQEVKVDLPKAMPNANAFQGFEDILKGKEPAQIRKDLLLPDVSTVNLPGAVIPEVKLPSVGEVKLPEPQVMAPLAGMASPSNPEGGLGDIGSLTAAMNAAPTELTTAFGLGNAGLSAVTSELSAVAAAFGPEVGAVLLAIAPQMGAIMGAAVSAAVSNATVNVNASVTQEQQGPSLGPQLPRN